MYVAIKRQPNEPRTINAARRLRRDATIPEALLWSVLRDGGLGGLKFRRQHPIGPYAADFYCHCAGLVVELDGMSHDNRADADRTRTRYLERTGLRVIRFLNDDVVADIDAVAEAILRAARPDV